MYHSRGVLAVCQLPPLGIHGHNRCGRLGYAQFPAGCRIRLAWTKKWGCNKAANWYGQRACPWYIEISVALLKWVNFVRLEWELQRKWQLEVGSDERSPTQQGRSSWWKVAEVKLKYYCRRVENEAKAKKCSENQQLFNEYLTRRGLWRWRMMGRDVCLQMLEVADSYSSWSCYLAAWRLGSAGRDAGVSAWVVVRGQRWQIAGAWAVLHCLGDDYFVGRVAVLVCAVASLADNSSRTLEYRSGCHHHRQASHTAEHRFVHSCSKSVALRNAVASSWLLSLWGGWEFEIGRGCWCFYRWRNFECDTAHFGVTRYVYSITLYNLTVSRSKYCCWHTSDSGISNWRR